MVSTTRIAVYGMLIPGLIGLTAMAAIVLPGGGNDLSLTRLLCGGAVMTAIQIIGGYTGGRIAGRHHAHLPL